MSACEPSRESFLQRMRNAPHGKTKRRKEKEQKGYRFQLSVIVPSLQPLAPSTQTLHKAAGERRQLTVMFIDLVGSEQHYSQQLDPEDYHAQVRAYQTACRRVGSDQRYDSHVPDILGDGVAGVLWLSSRQ